MTITMPLIGFKNAQRLLPALAFTGMLVATAHAHANGHTHTCGCMACSQASSTASDGVSTAPDELRLNNRWSSNVNAAGFTGSRGDAITLTYGLVPDGTTITGSEGTSGSDLIAFLNTNIGPSTIWLPLFQQSYGRWAEISGLTMVYEANDDGNANGGINNTSPPYGETGVRPDMRIGGHYIDGPSGSNTLAYNYYPSHGDQVMDTSNTSFFSSTSNNYRRLRNTIMHEAGHGIGIRHTESNNSGALMEPFISTSFDGPQHDDILAAQRYYGDAWEKNGGNDTTGSATGLGTFTGPTQTFSIGTDADDNTAFVGATEIDFISIDGLSDTDVFSFTLTGGPFFDIDILLNPKGPTYNEAAQGGTQQAFNTKALSDLELELLDSGGSTLFTANANAAGVSESILTTLAAGSYFARVSTQSGAADNVQLYQLDITATAIPEPSTLAPMALGGLLIMRRRRRQTAA